MATAGYTIRISTLKDDFPHCMRLVESGKSVEIINKNKILGVMQPNRTEETSDHIFTEKDALIKLRQVFDLTAQGKTVIITRIGKPAVLVKPEENNEPK